MYQTSAQLFRITSTKRLNFQITQIYKKLSSTYFFSFRYPFYATSLYTPIYRNKTRRRKKKKHLLYIPRRQSKSQILKFRELAHAARSLNVINKIKRARSEKKIENFLNFHNYFIFGTKKKKKDRVSPFRCDSNFFLSLKNFSSQTLHFSSYSGNIQKLMFFFFAHLII